MPSTKYKQRKTPGVYITELAAFPPSIIGVQTAVPAFVGYTQTAEIGGKPIYNKPVNIHSLVDYEAVFGRGYKTTYAINELNPTVPADKEKIDAGDYDFKVFDAESTPPEFKYYFLAPKDDEKSFNLYNSMRLFFENGGGNCYVVSVGNYTEDITKDKLAAGLEAISEQSGPTMLVMPDAVLLPPTTATPVVPYVSQDFKDITNAMINQSAELKDRVAILDVYGTNLIGSDAEITMDKVIAEFRTDLNQENLSYGMSYFPFLETTVQAIDSVNYTYVDPDIGVGANSPYHALKEVLDYQNYNLYYDPDADPINSKQGGARYLQIEDDISKLEPISSTFTAEEATCLNQNLSAALPLLSDISAVILLKSSQLPPSGAMAGVYTRVDNSKGVWNAPANVSLTSVRQVSQQINNEQQGDLNVPVDGKAVNAIREFPGRGTLVWGARTLDGNSNDWRYVQVRRTLVYVEQSIKKALDQFVFAANDGQTWTTVTSMVSNFLQGLWSQGGLMGATASEAFTVECGLGSTMTGQDVLEGYMIVQVTLQMIRPAEFIELTFKQKMEGVS